MNGKRRRLVAGVLGVFLVAGMAYGIWWHFIGRFSESTEDAYRGRVMSIFLLDYGLWSFGTLWLGWISDHRGPATAVLTGAGSCLLVVLGVAWVARRRRQLAQAERMRLTG